ncbi:DUF3775 domain-containing protein [Phaeobacter sp. HF9A]|uniref:DUF3775 domain-containing protein n=1 Tax=Phaeobacter sp. HF9A TaxID=2721561 RepID=UPI0014322F5C|nr:DUF3775 domain-containing protein [Phaeobacter sp. HF9A]NIZ14189.1 DUF3775 domain-containing protein [Phaeobacter sp. HF9A]
MVEIATNKAEQVAVMAREIERAEPELRAFIADMNEDEQAELVAILWIGRGSFEAEEFALAVTTAREEKTTPTEDYLLSTPNLAYDIEAGLEALGVDVAALTDDVLGR